MEYQMSDIVPTYNYSMSKDYIFYKFSPILGRNMS